MSISLKIPKHIPAAILRSREVRNVYQTNRAIKALSLFLYYKNQTIAGYINNPEAQLKTCLYALNISRATYYNYLNYAKRLGLIEAQKGRLKLASWHHLCNSLNIPKHFIIIKYETSLKLEHIITALEFHFSQEKQKKQVQSIITQTPTIKEAYYNFCKEHRSKTPFSIENLWKAQLIAFKYGLAHRDYKNLFLVNPDLNRSNSGIARDLGYKSKKLSTYTKRKLQKFDLIKVTKRAPICCYYKGGRKCEDTKGKNGNAFTFYSGKVNRWHLCDSITLNEDMIKTSNV